jgi:hypothetical protein
MNKYWSAPVWENQYDAPNTAPKAQPSKFTEVKLQTVIDAKEIQFRSAHFGGVFVLGDKNTLPLPKHGWHTVEVYCCWFGLRLKTRGLHFTVNMSTAKIIEKYSGAVVSNLSNKES